MTDEGVVGQPMDAVELLQAMRDGAVAWWTLFRALQDEGFTEQQALTLVAAQVHAASGGKLS